MHKPRIQIISCGYIGSECAFGVGVHVFEIPVGFVDMDSFFVVVW